MTGLSNFFLLLWLWYNDVAFELPEVIVPLLRDSLQLISTQPGALIYYLVTLFAIQLIVGVAIGHWQRRRDEDSTRLLVMGAGLFLARAILMIVAILDRVGLVSSDVVIPPLERLLHLTSIVLTVWAFLPISRQIRGLSTGILIVTVVIAVGTYAAFAALWPGAEAVGTPYNGYWQESVWELSTTAILTLALVGSTVWREAEWGWLAGLLTLWLAGHGLQLAVPVVESNTPGWVRLANLAALPLLAALVFRRALTSLSLQAEESEDTRESTLGAVGILRAVQRIKAEGTNVDSALEFATPSIARTVDADMVAVGLSAPGPIDVVRIVALHPTTGVMLAGQEPTLIVSKHPILATAFQSRHIERAIGERKTSRVAGLYRRLGFDMTGPLLVQPLTAEEEILGIILVGNPDSRRKWSNQEEQILQAVAAVLASAVAGGQRSEEMSHPDLQEARAKTQRMAERAEQLEAELERQRQRTEELSTTLRLREKEVSKDTKASAAAAFWQEEVRNLAETRDALQEQLSQWRQKARKLGEAKADLEEQLNSTSPRAGQPDDGRFSGILVGDKKGRIVLASQAIHQLLGRSRPEVIDTHLEALFDESLWKNTVRRLLSENGQPHNGTVVSLDLGERIAQAELVRLPENESWAGRIAAVFYIGEGASVQSEMVASLIQELRTPMTSITGYTELLLEEKVGILGESQHQFLLRIEANIKRMEALLNDLIKATDVDAGQVDLTPEPVDLGDVLEDTLDSFSARLKEKELDVHADLSQDLPPVYADRDSLRQVVFNLTSNAILASKPGTGIDIRAHVEGRPDELEGLSGYVLFSITDTGGGIDPEYQRHVFQRFYQAKNPLIEGMGETGVGLSVAKALVEANGGRIWVESETDVGSTFSFILPLSPPEELEEVEAIRKHPGHGVE
jgi:signal transduction histidine kinase